MLTSEQIIQLKSLTNHPKYGKLLKSAITNWKKVKPIQHNMGIKKLNGSFKKLKKISGCCLLGACILNKKISSKNPFNYILIQDEIEKRFKISNSEFDQLMNGFDGYNGTYSQDVETWKFANDVSKIVIGNKTC